MRCVKCGREYVKHTNCANCSLEGHCHSCGKGTRFALNYSDRRSVMSVMRSIEPCLCGDPYCGRCFPGAEPRYRVIFHPQRRPALPFRMIHSGNSSANANGAIGWFLKTSQQRGRLTMLDHGQEVRSWRIGSR